MLGRFSEHCIFIALFLGVALVTGAFSVAKLSSGAIVCQLSGVVLDDATGEALSGVKVRVPGRETITDGEGRFCFSQMDGERIVQLILSVIDSHDTHVECLVEDFSTTYVPVSAILDEKVAVIVAQPKIPGSVELRLKALSEEGVEAFCTNCHTWNPCFSQATPQEMEAIFDSCIPGVFVRRDELSEFLDTLNEVGLTADVYTSIRYTCIHAQSIDMDNAIAQSKNGNVPKLKKPSNIVLLQGRYTSCDTCHTRHAKGETAYLRLSYDESSSQLCLQCHL